MLKPLYFLGLTAIFYPVVTHEGAFLYPPYIFFYTPPFFIYLLVLRKDKLHVMVLKTPYKTNT